MQQGYSVTGRPFENYIFLHEMYFHTITNKKIEARIITCGTDNDPLVFSCGCDF